MPVVTTPSVRKLLTLSLTESESWPTTVPVCKVSLSSTLPVVDVDLDLVLSFLRDFPLTTVESPSFLSLSLLLLRSLLPLWSHTTLCHTLEFTSCLHPMPLSFPPRRPTTSNFLLPKSPTLCSSHPTCLLSVILVTVSSWLVA